MEHPGLEELGRKESELPVKVEIIIPHQPGRQLQWLLMRDSLRCRR